MLPLHCCILLTVDSNYLIAYFPMTSLVGFVLCFVFLQSYHLVGQFAKMKKAERSTWSRANHFVYFSTVIFYFYLFIAHWNNDNSSVSWRASTTKARLENLH